MRFRIKTVTFHGGKKNYFAQRLTLLGYKHIGNAHHTMESAEEYIQKLKAKKFEHKYIW